MVGEHGGRQREERRTMGRGGEPQLEEECSGVFLGGDWGQQSPCKQGGSVRVGDQCTDVVTALGRRVSMGNSKSYLALFVPASLRRSVSLHSSFAGLSYKHMNNICLIQICPTERVLFTTTLPSDGDEVC